MNTTLDVGTTRAAPGTRADGLIPLGRTATARYIQGIEYAATIMAECAAAPR